MSRISAKLWVGVGALLVVVVGATILSFPPILAVSIEQERAFALMLEQFPVTVNPQEKRIVESEHVNTFLESPNSPLQAAVGNVGNVFWNLFAWLATGIADAPWYQSLGAVAISSDRFVTITPGMRKEQVATVFAKTLGWNEKQKKEFLTASSPDTFLPLPEGSFAPGIYTLGVNTTPSMAQALVNKRFENDVLARYGPEIAKIVPLAQALIIASLIEREAGGADDMRIISGIIWNRLFINMKLQIDATLQYAKANTNATQSWWPRVVPADRFRKSPYNTYLHAGLPPNPIANPSVASIIATLNPRNTPCIFYFHDAAGGFHCTDTYVEHVALLKKYYGRGK